MKFEISKTRKTIVLREQRDRGCKNFRRRKLSCCDSRPAGYEGLPFEGFVLPSGENHEDLRSLPFGSMRLAKSDRRMSLTITMHCSSTAQAMRISFFASRFPRRVSSEPHLGFVL